jgi:archaellum component FlaC
LEPTATIKAPDGTDVVLYSEGEIERIKRLLPQYTEARVRDLMKDVPDFPEQVLPAFVEMMPLAMSNFIGNFYNDVYSKSNSPITEEMIRNWVTANVDDRSKPLTPLIVEALKVYYLNQSTTMTSQPTGAMEGLNKKYQDLDTQYREAAEKALSATTAETINAEVEKLRALNLQIAAVLEQMLAMVADVKNETGSLRIARDELTMKLTRIQRDYSDLNKQTDRLETLRRIRQYEQVVADRSMYLYLGIFLAFCLLLLLVVLIKGYFQKKLAMTPMPMAASITPPLT